MMAFFTLNIISMKTHTLITGVLFFLLVNKAHAQKNLVYNGGFEDDLSEWNNNNNGPRTTPWDFKEGKNACAIITHDATNWVGIDQTISIPKKVQAIEFSAWLKAENIIKGKDAWNGGVYSIEFLDKYDKKVGDDINIATLSGDEPWQLLKKAMKVPDTACRFKIMFAMGNASGTMLVDDVKAMPVNAEDLAK
jgi:hypothetical protein